VARRSRAGLATALALAAAVLAADQLSKWLVRREAAELPWRLLGGIRIDLHYNRGISFSRLADAGDVVIALVAAVSGGVAVALVLAPARYRPALGIILGGALANVVDRLRFDGAVADFIRLWGWPTFNLADVAIVAGTGLLALQVLRASRS
jgi:signal peptidase II